MVLHVTIIFPDVSEYNGAYNFTGAPVALARACIGNVRDRLWDTNKLNASLKGVPLAAYAFLNAPSLGVSVNVQADFAFAVVGASTPMMIDVEPNRGACASFADVMSFADRYRSHGGICHLCYLPRWAWQGNMGSPNLVPLEQAGIHLVSSNYTTYTDYGLGWSPYGGVAPIQWQFTDNLNGTHADGNAYKGTAAEWWAMASGSKGTDDVTPEEHRLLQNTEHYLWRMALGEDPIKSILDPAGNEVVGGIPNVPMRTARQALALATANSVALAGLGKVTLTEEQASVLATSISAVVAQAVVANHDALTPDDLAGVQASAAAAVRNVLGGLG